MNILILNWSGHYGGVEKHLLLLARSLDARRYRLIFAGPAGEFPRLLREAGYPWYEVAMRPGLDVESMRRLVRIMRDERIAVLHAQQSRGLYLGAPAARWAGVQAIIQTEHNISIDWHRRASLSWRVRLGSNLLRYLFVRFVVCRIIALSSGVARFYTDILRIPPGKITIIPHAHLPLPTPIEAARQTDAPVIGTVANLTEQKGLAYLIQAADIVRQSRPDVRFRIIGGGPLEAALRRQAAEQSLGETVELTGFRPNATALMAGFSLFVLPSLWEPFGLVLLEAMANSLPVVATRVDGIADVVQDGQTGLLVPPADPPALAAAILRLLADPPAAAEMGRRGRLRCQEEYSVESMAQRFAAVYDECARHIHHS